MSPYTQYGPGDYETWGPRTDSPNDPRNDPDDIDIDLFLDEVEGEEDILDYIEPLDDEDLWGC